MKYSIIIILLTSVCLNALSIGDWQDIRFSGRSNDGEVLTRFELNQPALQENLLWHDPGTGVTQISTSLYDPETGTYEGSVPTGTSRKYLGLSMISGTYSRKLVPVFYPGTGLPALNQMTKASDDAANDQSDNFRDIIADYVSISDTKIYAAIRNRGGGFPFTSSFGTMINSYMVALADPNENPDDPNAIAWAMVYWNFTLGGLSPGLYKLQGSTATRIGNIEYQVVSGSNLLVMSCSIADLLAQADFSAWYNPANPVVGMQSLINRTSLFQQTTLMDKSPGVTLLPVPLYIDPVPNTIPELSQAQFHNTDNDIYFSVVYTDAEANFPRSIEVRLQNDDSMTQLYTTAGDYSQPVMYRSANLTSSLGERVNDHFRVETSDDGENTGYSDWIPYERILGIRTPEQLEILSRDGELVINWQPVTQTLLGNPITPSYYRLEASPGLDFTNPEILGTTISTTYTVPAVQERHFYRVVAVRDLEY